MKVEQVSGAGSLWLRWVLANAAGFALGLVIWGVLGDTLGEHGFTNNPLVIVPAQLLAFLVVGAVAGTLQRLALQPYVTLSVANVIGGSIGFAVGFVLGFALGGPPVDFVFGFLFFALVTAVIQWRALRNQVRKAGRWLPAAILVQAIGGVVAVAIMAPIGDALDAAFGGGLLAFAVLLCLLGAIAGAVGGALGGAVLVRLLYPQHG